jgi:murein DD-endopeptidase MepM/ murein hydrolase activator NlpD
MSWKVSNYNALRDQVTALRSRYQQLQQENIEKKEQLASLQLMASEVSVALGLKRRIEGADDIAHEGPLVPSYRESIEEYNFLKSASYSRVNHLYARRWQTNVVPTMWPVNGRLLSRFGEREDPFSGEGALHTGVDISASMATQVHAAADGILAGTEEWWRSITETACRRGTHIFRALKWCRGRKSAGAMSWAIRVPLER